MDSEAGFNFQNIIFTDIFFNQIAEIVFYSATLWLILGLLHWQQVRMGLVVTQPLQQPLYYLTKTTI